MPLSGVRPNSPVLSCAKAPMHSELGYVELPCLSDCIKISFVSPWNSSSAFNKIYCLHTSALDILELSAKLIVQFMHLILSLIPNVKNIISITGYKTA